jgi:hypothetical protein
MPQWCSGSSGILGARRSRTSPLYGTARGRITCVFFSRGSGGAGLGASRLARPNRSGAIVIVNPNEAHRNRAKEARPAPVTEIGALANMDDFMASFDSMSGITRICS